MGRRAAVLPGSCTSGELHSLSRVFSGASLRAEPPRHLQTHRHGIKKSCSAWEILRRVICHV